ncbi:hypothetical protein DMB92_08335 [Campylobacter sp. MIT 99-7217]|uniref:hypothetical protein n=1 Tax=Campylobacter sp. MIT 99-7217 TaxID=535091 RepID=UPI00115898C8|nr:hypothetical protein [Campylobacter sp. MIT 99-7217]TQR29360.1 hypothetical protein DMB92_08335 [Campylobacter sp. MIT 99-7217]
MSYSFIKPKLKSALSLLTKIWLIFFIGALGFIVLVYFFLATRYLLTSSELSEKKEELVKMQEKTLQNEESFRTLSQRKNIALKIRGKDGSNEIEINRVLNNLFSIVISSGSIRLNELEMNENSLKISGVTPTKEMFSLLIQTPLKSTFDESRTTFYPLQNGWYGFLSINKKLSGVQE